VAFGSLGWYHGKYSRPFSGGIFLFTPYRRKWNGLQQNAAPAADRIPHARKSSAEGTAVCGTLAR